jgi:proline iminopeptidase
MNLIRIFFLCMILASCTQPDTRSPLKEIITVKEYFSYDNDSVRTAGVKMIPVTTPSGEFKVWTKRIGNNPKIKVLLLHGGPAITHEYFESFESFLPAEGIEFYYYDQLGSHYSEQPKDSNLWTLDRFVEEVEQVRVALGLNKDNCYLLGQSWGGILAMQYALKYQHNIKALIIANMMASFPAYGAYNATLRAQLRPSLIDTLEMYEKADNYTDPVYQQLVMDEFYRKHICRIAEWPDALNRTFNHLNPDVYVLMQGPSEFVPGGRLKNWDVMDELQNITVPTLMIGAHYDTMDPKAMEEQSKRVKNGRYLYCPNGSHLAMWDDQQHFFPGLIQFLHDVDEGRM